MICCLCGEPLEVGEAGLRIVQFVVGVSPGSNRMILRPLAMEDGTQEKFTHSICPALNGAPLEMTGAGGGHNDL